MVLGHFVTRYSNVTIDVNHCSILADSSSGDRTLFFLTGGFLFPMDDSVEIRWIEDRWKKLEEVE